MTEIVSESLVADQNTGLSDRLDQDYAHLAGQLDNRGIDIEAISAKAMSFAVAGLAVDGQKIEDEMCVAKSFPDFWERFEVFTK